MLRRKANNYALTLLSIVTISLVMIGVASAAFAQNPTVVIDGAGNICPGYGGYTARFAICIQNTVGWALNRYLVQFFSYFIDTVNIACVFAVLIWGITAFMGKPQSVSRTAFMLAIKIGFIVFLINLGGYITLFPALIDIVNWMVNIVTGYTAIDLSPHCPYAPFIWHRIDCALNMLIGGIFQPTTISFGFIGFIFAMLFSKGIGIALFFFGLAIVIQTILAVLHALFILLSAYIALALLAIVAPLVIPLILFKNTKAYFEKWLRMTFGVMLQPVFLFAYLSLFLIAMEIAIFTGPYSIYRSIACNAVDNPQFSIGAYVINSGQLQQRSGPEALWAMVVSQETRSFAGAPSGATQQVGGMAGNNAVTNVGPDGSALFRNNGVSIDLSVDALNIEQMAAMCRLTPLQYIIRMVLSFFAAAAVIYIFYTMLHVVPYLGTLISGDLFGLPNLSNMIPMNAVQGNQLMKRLGFGGG